MSLILSAVKTEPESYNLAEWDVNITVKRATLADEGRRYAMLFGSQETAIITDIAMVEGYLTIIGCDIFGEDEKPLISMGMPYEHFVEAMTAIWQHSPDLFWAVHEKVRQTNSHWMPPEEETEEGNAPTT